jgi:hypothetical protein
MATPYDVPSEIIVARRHTHTHQHHVNSNRSNEAEGKCKNSLNKTKLYVHNE